MKVVLNETEYEVLARVTPEDVDRSGLPLVAADWRRRGIVAMLSLRRPRGSIGVAAYEFENGRYSSPFRTGPR